MQKSTKSVRTLAILFLTIIFQTGWLSAVKMPRIKVGEFKAYVETMQNQITALKSVASMAATAEKFTGAASAVMSAFFTTKPNNKKSNTSSRATSSHESSSSGSSLSSPAACNKAQNNKGLSSYWESQVEKAAYLERYFGNQASIKNSIEYVATNPPQFIEEVFNEYLALPVKDRNSDSLAEILHRKNVENFRLPKETTYQQLFEAVTEKNPDQSYVISDEEYFRNTSAVLLVLYLENKVK